MSEENELMPWDFTDWLDNEDNGYSILCVWPGTSVKATEKDDVTSWFTEQFNLQHPIVPVGVVVTDPDRVGGQVVEDTGGRHDFMFYVHDADIPRFAVPRLMAGIRWWEDVVGNKNHKIYPKEFLSELREIYDY